MEGANWGKDCSSWKHLILMSVNVCTVSILSLSVAAAVTQNKILFSLPYLHTQLKSHMIYVRENNTLDIFLMDFKAYYLQL